MISYCNLCRQILHLYGSGQVCAGDKKPHTTSPAWPSTLLDYKLCSCGLHGSTGRCYCKHKMKTTEHSKWGTFTKGLQARFLRLWCNLQKSWWERVIPLKRMGFFSSINLLPFSPLTAGTSNSTNPVYLLKRHFLSHLLSAGYSHTTALPSVHLSLRHHFVSALIPLWETPYVHVT